MSVQIPTCSLQAPAENDVKVHQMRQALQYSHLGLSPEARTEATGKKSDQEATLRSRSRFAKCEGWRTAMGACASKATHRSGGTGR